MLLSPNAHESDLEALIEAQVEESRTLDFKRETYDDNKEFCADVVSFANASGGIIIIGMSEEESVAKEVTGLPGIDCDGEKLRLQNIVDTSIEPRIPGVSITSISLQDTAKGNVIVVRIPRSFAGPHRVKRDRKFHIRRDSGKIEMEMDEIRRAFSLSESVANDLRSFKESRVRAIKELSGEEITDWDGILPVDLEGEKKLILHILPFSSVSSSNQVDIANIQGTESTYYNAIQYGQYNIDGFVLPDGHNRPSYSGYTQFFRNGAIELVREIYSPDARITYPPSNHTDFIDPFGIEDTCVREISAMLQIQDELGIDYPRVIMISFLGIQGYKFQGALNLGSIWSHNPIRRSQLLLPELVLMTNPTELENDLKPIFDAFWNSVGLRKSQSYDENGQWTREQK